MAADEVLPRAYAPILLSGTVSKGVKSGGGGERADR